MCAGALLAEHRDERRGESTLWQVSTLDALLQGVYQGATTYGDVARHGDFGVGTFEGVDGEMVALNGKFYQVRSDGKVTRVKASQTTPFAVVTFFNRDLKIEVTKPTSLTDLATLIDKALPSANLFYAVKLHGTYIDLTLRSVPKQVTPYPPLATVVAQQSVFPLHNIVGTAVGFRSPNFVKGINQTGYHFHFISDDEQYGGHALSGLVLNGTVEVEVMDKFEMQFPGTAGFLGATLPLP